GTEQETQKNFLKKDSHTTFLKCYKGRQIAYLRGLSPFSLLLTVENGIVLYLFIKNKTKIRLLAFFIYPRGMIRQRLSIPERFPRLAPCVLEAGIPLKF
ncbi:MAG: hypothetical protein SPE99_02470, partial [Blautia sp.]|nr:hypothetical protein [Blautia sp.]